MKLFTKRMMLRNGATEMALDRFESWCVGECDAEVGVAIDGEIVRSAEKLLENQRLETLQVLKTQEGWLWTRHLQLEGQQPR